MQMISTPFPLTQCSSSPLGNGRLLPELTWKQKHSFKADMLGNSELWLTLIPLGK